MIKVLCFDIGGTNLRGALIDGDYKVLKVEKIPTKHQGNEIFLQQIEELATRLLSEKNEVKAIVFGVPGRVSKTTYLIDALPNVGGGLKDLDLVAPMQKLFPDIPVFVYNDAELAGLYEANKGNGRHHKRVVYLTVSTGFGVCLFDHKKWIPSSYETGHTLVKYQEEEYELEHLISGNGIVKLAALNGLKIHNAKEFFQGFSLSMAPYILVFEEWIKLFTSFVQMTNQNFAPDAYIIGGGVAFNAPYFIYALKQRNQKTKFKVSSKIDDAGLLGGVTLIEYLQKGINPFDA